MHRGIDLWNDSLCIVGLTCGMFIRDIAKIYSCIFAMHRGIDLWNDSLCIVGLTCGMIRYASWD